MTSLGPSLIFLGLVIALISWVADVIGILGPAGSGWLQIAGAVVGIALIGAGIARGLSEIRSPARDVEAPGPTSDQTNGFPPPP
jgi:hypothetical protein